MILKYLILAFMPVIVSSFIIPFKGIFNGGSVNQYQPAHQSSSSGFSLNPFRNFFPKVYYYQVQPATTTDPPVTVSPRGEELKSE